MDIKNRLVKEHNCEVVALMIEERTELNLVVIDEHKMETAEHNSYYLFGGKDNKLCEVEVIINKNKWNLNIKEFKSSFPFKPFCTLEFN